MNLPQVFVSQGSARQNLVSASGCPPENQTYGKIANLSRPPDSAHESWVFVNPSPTGSTVFDHFRLRGCRRIPALESRSNQARRNFTHSASFTETISSCRLVMR